MIARLLAALDRAIDFVLRSPGPARWDDEIHEAICRHPAGKQLRPGP